MRKILISCGLASLLTGCGHQAVQVEATVTDLPPVTLDCRPYPKPDKLNLRDIEPENRADGWYLSHEDYLRLAENWKAVQAYVRQSRAAAQGIVSCIEAFNDQQREKKKTPQEPEPVRRWWDFWRR